MMTMKTNTTAVEERPYLLCAVRLSPEKEPERFVELVEELSARGTLQELNLTPYLIGAATTPYAEVKLPPRHPSLMPHSDPENLQKRPSIDISLSIPHLQGLKARLRSAVPSSIIKESFVDAAELASIASSTRVNFHPCLYDAYGMTIVEVASQVSSTAVPHHSLSFSCGTQCREALIHD